MIVKRRDLDVVGKIDLEKVYKSLKINKKSYSFIINGNGNVMNGGW